MKSPLRVLLIGRHFWPHGSVDSAGYLIQLACGLYRRGTRVEILTPRYSPGWTKEFFFREMQVHRPASAAKSDWSMGRYTRHVTNWIREHARTFDVLLVDAAREEAVAAIDATRSFRCRCVVRVTDDDLIWWETSRSARRCAGFCKTADRIVVSNSQTQRGLLTQGFSPSRIQRIEVGCEPAIATDESRRIQARRALAAINSDLHAPPDEPVLLCLAPMKRKSGVQILVESARHLVARYPTLHLWLIGDGPGRDSIYNTLRADGVRASLAMPGSFGTLEDVFSAADLFVHTEDSGRQSFLPSAVAGGIPLVAIDNPTTREAFRLNDASRDQSPLVHWYQPQSPKSFRKAVRAVLDDLPASRESAALLRRELLKRSSQVQVVNQYVQLFEKLRQERLSHPHGTSMGAVS